MNIYCKRALTGGVSGCLDAIDGSILNDGDRAIVITSTYTYHLILDADSGLAESSPDIIAPDTNAGNKRWVLVEDADDGSGSGGTSGTYQTYYPDATEPDQGVASGETNKTIYDIITSVGTSKIARIVLRHSGSGNTTSYAFDTSLNLTTYPNIFFEFEPGALVSKVTGDEYLTVYSTGNIITPRENTICLDYTLVFAKGATIYPEWYGAKGDGATDDTWAIQCAIAALPPIEGGEIEFGSRTYLYTTLTVGKPVSFKGQNRSTTILRTTQATGNKISITIGRAVKICDLTLDSSVTQTGGAYVYMYGPVYENHGSVFRDLIISGAYVGFDFETCAGWVIDRCYFPVYTTAIYINNLATPDNGDSIITNCIFDAGGSTGTAINQRASGGLRVLNNKFLRGKYHYYGLFYSSSNTSILIFSGNSSEDATVANFYISASGSTTFGKIVIEGNQFSVVATGINIVNTGVAYLDSVLIGNNIFGLGNNAYGMIIGSGNRIVLTPNAFSGDGTGETGIQFGAGIVRATVHRQIFYNLSYGFTGITTYVTFVDAFTLRGTATGATANAYGSLYITNPINITFSTSFPQTPYVKATVNSLTSNGGVSAVVAYVTTTGFQLYIIGVTNAKTLSVDWEARLVS